MRSGIGAEMVDIHNHVLPFVDDGSADVEQSLNILSEFGNDGVTDVILTPHFRNAFNKTPEEIEAVFEEFKNTMAKRGIPVNIHLGQEIFVTDALRNQLKNGQVMTLNGTKYVLIEFDYEKPCEVCETVYELVQAGYVPVIAHIERYSYLNVDDAIEVKQIGGLIQVNADSIVGENRKRYFGLIKKLFKLGLVDFVSSDIHCGRRNRLAEAKRFVEKKFGSDASEVTFRINGERIINAGKRER